ncbi:MAG: dimethylmenaquinone methyltransferase [Acidobacteria bacterium]|nr:MAG: dimethylmenaquinone methyltransferase [Acidobacteriota bacterium]
MISRTARCHVNRRAEIQSTVPFLVLVFVVALPLQVGAQVFTFTREQMIKYTAKNPFDRFADGRPKIPEALLEKAKGLSSEEVFAVLPGAKFPNQYEGNWQLLHPGRKLVGRAVTAQFMPYRPDVAEVSEAEAKARGLGQNPNQRVIDMLQPDDVIVVDLFGKIENGTFIGDNLATAIYAATKTGFVFDGAVRDLEGIFPIQMAGYFRGVHPSAIGNVMLTGVNIPVRIGNATVMPGDLVFGDREGVYFVPPHLLEEIMNKAEETHIHDEWTKNKFLTGKYKSSEIYPSPSDPALKKEYDEYLKKKLRK